MSKTGKISPWPLVGCVLLAAAIFALDLSLPLGVAGGVPYVILVLVSLGSSRRSFALIAATAGTVLTILGFFLSPSGGILWVVLFNRFLALFAIWVTATLGLRRKRAEEALKEAHENLEFIVDERTAKLQKTTQQLSALYSVTATASKSLEVDSVLQEVIKKITEIFHFDATRIFLFNPQMDELQLKASFETQPEFWAKLRVYQRGEGIAGKVAESGDSLIFEDTLSDPLYQELSHSSAAKKAGNSFLAVFPIKSKQRTVGTINCIGRKPRRLTTEESHLITSMTGQIGIAIENANLFEETVARTKELSTLYSVSTAVNQSLDLESLLCNVMRKVLEIFDFDASFVYILDNDGKKLCLVAQEGYPRDATLASTKKLGVGISGKVFETGEPLFFEDLQNDPWYKSVAHDKALLREGYRGHFAIPIGVKGRTLGVISFASRKAHPFSASEVQLMHSIADRIGTAVENAQLYKQSKNQAVELEKEITERKQVEERLVQAAKLAALGQLGAGIAHELNQPITTIQGFSQRIKRDGGRQLADHTDELDLIINATHRMARIVDNIRTFSRQSDFKSRPIDPLVPLDDALMLISEQLRLHGIEVEKPVGDGLPRVMGDQVKLQQVFSNLIMNALDSLETLPSDRPRHLVLGVRAEGDRVVYSVEDNGPGISEEDQLRIFDPFFTTKEVGKGTGLGLSITHGIVTDHGGEIRYEPVEGRGARFLVSLPIAPVEITEGIGGYEQEKRKYVG